MLDIKKLKDCLENFKPNRIKKSKRVIPEVFEDVVTIQVHVTSSILNKLELQKHVQEIVDRNLPLIQVSTLTGRIEINNK